MLEEVNNLVNGSNQIKFADQRDNYKDQHHGSNSNRPPKHERTYVIFVNGRRFEWEKPIISFEEVISLAFGGYNPAPHIAYTVSYFNGPKEYREGTLTKGHFIPVKDGEKINADRTDRS